MPAFCQRCGEPAEGDACAKCGEKAVVGVTTNKWKVPAAGGSNPSVSAVPSAFTTAARIQSMGVSPVVVERPRKEKATALFNFIPQDSATQLKLTKGDEVEVVRKDPDGWWFVIKDGEKGLVPGSYIRIDNPFVAVPDTAILAAREASNQRFMEYSRSSAATLAQAAENESNVEYSSPLGIEGAPPAPVLPRARNSPVRADVRAGDGTGEKPQNVRKLRKCFACKETILGRTKTAKDQIFHEICLLCKGCREPIEEDEDYILIKKKAYHADCGQAVAHCYVCDKEILGRVYKAGEGSFHRLCMICSVCSKQADEAGSKFENDKLVCGSCVAEKERKEREEREARERAAREKAEREAAEAAARALAEKKAREEEEAARAKMEAAARAKAEAEAAARAKAEAEAAAAAARAKEAEEAARAKAEAEAAAAAAGASAKRSGYDSQRSSTAGLDEFDLGATPLDLSSHERVSEVSDFGSVLDSEYNFSNTGRDSMRLSEVLDLESIDAFNSGQNRISDISGLSLDGGAPKERPRRSTLQEDREEYLSDEDEDRELCGGCGLILEGEAVGALNQYFHYECFKCSHCRRVIAEDDGYAEKDNMAFHQACYQTRFGKKCCRCTQVLKGKVVKALDNLYHPDCFVCFKCSASLSESFFEHDGQAVCAKCKHDAIAYAQAPAPAEMTPIGTGVAGYRFDAQDVTQLTIYPGDKVTILQKDDDGWWLVSFNNQRGYVPGSYLIEERPAPPKAKAVAVPGLCSECGTQNPGVARFCRSCGNGLQG